MLSEEEIKDIIEISELAKEEIKSNDENITATLDLQDLKSLKKLLDLYEKEKEKNNTLQTNYEILQGEMDRIGIDILGLEPGNSTDDVIDKIKALLKENRKLRNCHLRYEEMTGIDLLMEE